MLFHDITFYNLFYVILIIRFHFNSFYLISCYFMLLYFALVCCILFDSFYFILFSFLYLI